jgi:hypothetical protein
MKERKREKGKLHQRRGEVHRGNQANQESLK